jgi:hypothetical protein
MRPIGHHSAETAETETKPMREPKGGLLIQVKNRRRVTIRRS